MLIHNIWTVACTSVLKLRALAMCNNLALYTCMTENQNDQQRNSHH